MKRSYSDLDQHTGDPPFAFGAATRGPRQPKQYQQQTEPGTGKIKACMQCGTTRTPQWREGPYGPKTLCNACGVKRVRAIKAQQHGKNPGQVPHPAPAGGKKKAASAAARTESIELATTLQLLAGNLEAGPPPAKKRAGAAQPGPGRGRKANSLQPPATHMPEYDPYDPAAAAAMSAPALGSAVQKAIAAIAAKGSMGGESNPTDSGEEISWSPADHQQSGDAAAAAAAAGDGPGGRRQVQQLRAMAAAAAAAQLQGASAEQQEELMQMAGLTGQQITDAQQLEASLAEGYALAAAADAGQDGAGVTVDEEAAAVANLLSMSAASQEQQQRPSSSAGKAAMLEFVAQLSANATPAATAASKSPGRRQATRTPPPRHVVTVRQRSAAAAAAAAAAGAAAAAAAESLQEDDVMYLLGPGMPVMARHVAPEELLEVIKLNELASEAQRSKAAAEAAVEAVEQILRDKQTAALAAQSAARAAMQRLHSYVGELNTEHGLIMKAAQEHQPSSLASRLAARPMSHLDMLAASLQQQQQAQQMQQEAEQDVKPVMMDREDSLAGLAEAAAAAEAAAERDAEMGDVKEEWVLEEGGCEEPEGMLGGNVGGAGGLYVMPLALQGSTGEVCVDADAAFGGAEGAVVDAAAAAAELAAVPVVAAGAFSAAVDDVPAYADALPPQHAFAAVANAQQQLAAGLQQQLQDAAAAVASASLTGSAAVGAVPWPAQSAACAGTQQQAVSTQDVENAQLLGSLQELAAIAGMVGLTAGVDNNGVAAAGSPAFV